jgi:hypothetical protein
MNSTLAIIIDYWAVQEGKNNILQLAGIKEFQDSLSQSYVSHVHGRPGDLGGGLYEFAIQVIANVSLQDVMRLIADGIAFDLLKLGAKSFVLRPFLAAYKKLKAMNTVREVDIHEIKFLFNDAEVVISKICDDSIYKNLGQIFQVLAENFEHLRGRNGECPYSIQIPVFEDPEKRLCRFRVLLDVDETISNVTSANYFDYWGVEYDFDRTLRVFDVKRKLLIDSDYLTLDRYWQEWERDRANQDAT